MNTMNPTTNLTLSTSPPTQLAKTSRKTTGLVHRQRLSYGRTRRYNTGNAWSDSHQFQNMYLKGTLEFSSAEEVLSFQSQLDNPENFSEKYKHNGNNKFSTMIDEKDAKKLIIIWKPES